MSVDISLDTLSSISDVDISNVSDGQVLKYDSASSKWKNGTGGGGGASSLNDLSDVSISSASNGQVLSYSNNQWVNYSLSIPVNTSDLNNDSGFITNTVNNLTNYYLKSETYTKTEVDNLISAIVTLDIEVVQTLPTQDISTTTIYLVPKQTAGTQDVYDEYIYVNNAWELIGDTEVDLSNYYTKTEADNKFALKTDVPDDLNDLDDVNISSPTNGQGLVYNSTSSKWENSNVSGGHTIQNDSGTALTQRPNLQFVGTYSEDDSTNSKTKINIVRKMTTAQFNQLSADEKKGLIDITDEQGGPTDFYTKSQTDNLLNAKTNETSSFTEAQTRTNIASGDTITTILGKIKKFFTDLKTVAFTGSYTDLDDKPTIPDAQIQSDWTQSDNTQKDFIKNKPSLATVATSGAYSDLSGTPSLATVATSGDYGDLSNTPSLATVATSGSYSDLSNTPSLATVATSGSYSDLSNKPTIPSKTSQLTNDSGFITSDSTKVAKAGDTMSGMLTMNTVDNVAIDFRNNSGYHTTASYQTAGNEALVLATKNAVTSFIFVNGEDSITNHANSRWQSLTPGLQIKNNKVAIGKLITNGTTPTYALDVNGDARATTFDGNLKYTHSNEINFGGGNQSVCYFNYRNADTDQAAAVSSIEYKFCNYSNDTSKSKIVAGSFNGYTIQKSVPSNAVFTDTNNAVTQTYGTGNAAYSILLSSTGYSTSSLTEGARKGDLAINTYHCCIIAEAGAHMYFGPDTNANSWVFLGKWGGDWGFIPNGDNYHYLGYPGQRWKAVYAVNGSIQTSDRNQKKDIKNLDDFAKDFIMALTPVSYKRIDGDRTHYGLISQDVEDVLQKFDMTPMDFAGFCKDQKREKFYEEVEDEDGNKHAELKFKDVKGEFEYGLRYDEFIAPLIKTVQLQQQEIEELKKEIKELKEKMN